MMIYVLLVNSLVVVVSVLVHYELLYRLTSYVPRMGIRHKYRIVFGVFGALVAHAMEIWIFAISYYFMNRLDGWGSLEGNFDGSLMD